MRGNLWGFFACVGADRGHLARVGDLRGVGRSTLKWRDCFSPAVKREEAWLINTGKRPPPPQSPQREGCARTCDGLA